MTPILLSQITWNCCTHGQEPDWSDYDAIELGGCAITEGCTERVMNSADADFFTLFGHLKQGGCEAIHDWPLGFKEFEVIRNECAALADRVGLTFSDTLAWPEDES